MSRRCKLSLFLLSKDKIYIFNCQNKFVAVLFRFLSLLSVKLSSTAVFRSGSGNLGVGDLGQLGFELGDLSSVRVCSGGFRYLVIRLLFLIGLDLADLGGGLDLGCFDLTWERVKVTLGGGMADLVER